MLKIVTVSISSNSTGLLVQESEAVDVYFESQIFIGGLPDLSNSDDRFFVTAPSVGYAGKFTLPPNTPLYAFNGSGGTHIFKALIISVTGPKVCFTPGE